MKLLRAPLVRFLLLGAGLLVLYEVFGPGRDSRGEIVVTRSRVENLVRSFELVWQRPPTDAELRSLVDDYLHEEVLYREALAMGLDQDDAVIRRRLRQKMEFLAEDVSAVAEPTDEELRRFLEENRDRFLVDPRLSFEHVYLSTDRRGETTNPDAERLLAELRASRPSAGMGDPFLLPLSFESQTPSDVARAFGDAFSRELFAVEPLRWTGPIASGYGLHLVYVRDRVEGRLPDLAEIGDELRQAWTSERRREARDAFYRSLRDRYRVNVEIDGWEKD